MNNTFGRLNFLGALRIGGADAIGFLQGQLSNDLRRLVPNRALLAALSNAQGRVIAILRLIPHSGGVLAVMPRDLIPGVRDLLKKFVMRSKVQIEDAGDSMAVAGAFTGDALTSGGATLPAAADDYVEAGGIGIARLPGTTERYWVVGEPDRLNGLGFQIGSGSSGFETSWRLADIRAGFPQVFAATRELFVAQMLNLDLLDGISFTKGCYTGQEIIARTQHLGRIKRRMFTLRLPPGDYEIGDALRLTDGRSARLVEVAWDNSVPEGLAVMPLEADGAADDPGEAAEPRVAAVVSAPPYLQSV